MRLNLLRPTLTEQAALVSTQIWGLWVIQQALEAGFEVGIPLDNVLVMPDKVISPW